MNTPISGASSISCLGIDWQAVPLPEQLYRGDDAEIATVALGAIAAKYGEIYESEGQLWVYHADGYHAGTWQAINPDVFSVLIQRFSGLRIVVPPKKEGDAPSYRGLKVSSRLIDSVYNLALKLVSVETKAKFGDGGLFDNAVPCVVTRWCTFGIAGEPVVTGDDGIVASWSSNVYETGHSSRHRARHKIHTQHDVGKHSPRDWRGDSNWCHFLSDIFGSSDAPEADLLRQFVGACLFGQATKYQRALMLVGSGANGKSVFLDVISSLFAKGSIVSIAPQDLGDNSKGAALAGALLNVVSETPDRRVLASDTFKAIIVGDSITRRQLYQKPITFRPRAGHIFAANRLPLGTDTSDGFWRRWLVVPFSRVFKTEEQNPNLAREILDDDWERRAVILWALDGMSELLGAGGYTIPESSMRITDEWRTDSNPVALWLDVCCEIRDGDWESAAYCYEDYVRWSKANGFAEVNSKNFGLRLVELGVQKRRLSAGAQYGLKVFNAGAPGVREVVL